MRVVFILGLLGITASIVAAGETSPERRFRFRENSISEYYVRTNGAAERLQGKSGRGGSSVEITSRVVLRLKPGVKLDAILKGSKLNISRTVDENTFVPQAPDALTAASEAERLAESSEVLVSVPNMQRSYTLHGAYSIKPNDPYAFKPTPSTRYQWHLENRATNGAPAGADLNVRAAWPYTRGEGVTIGVADDGVEYTHPDLVLRAQGQPHLSLAGTAANGLPEIAEDKHATAVAGLAVAEANNSIGVAGVAPGAGLASWRIFSSTNMALTDEQLFLLFQYQRDRVAIQNHSWGPPGDALAPISVLADAGLNNGIYAGRKGLGVVIVRSAGNNRFMGANANIDGFLADYRSIGVAAVRPDGRVTSYSNPGACLLVAAPGGDTGYLNLVTTDRQGTAGFNAVSNSLDRSYWDYHFGFQGTSGAAPQIAGVAALVLSANTNLSYRDVQHILIHSARHFDKTDPGVITNAAGFQVSHNVGFGVPDAGMAVALARSWPTRPPATMVNYIATNTFCATNPAVIPDDGLRVVISGPTNWSFPATPSWGLHPDSPTLSLPLVDVGLAGGPISLDLTNRAALIQRGAANLFSNKIDLAAMAGAKIAIVYNNAGTSNRLKMGETYFVPIPAVFIGKSPGDALHNLLLQTNADAQLMLVSTNYTFTVTNALLCEHVSVRVKTDHARRADVRITLVSPHGTRSVLQEANFDNNPGPADWIYYSTHHFNESSYGDWTLCVSDEDGLGLGSVYFASLTIRGVAISDSDHDGLADDWELACFGDLTRGPKDDEDRDGFNNIREHIMGTDPRQGIVAPILDMSRWDHNLARLSWPAANGLPFELWSGTNVNSLSLQAHIPGQFPVAECFLPFTNTAAFFQLRPSE